MEKNGSSSAHVSVRTSLFDFLGVVVPECRMSSSTRKKRKAKVIKSSMTLSSNPDFRAVDSRIQATWGGSFWSCPAPPIGARTEPLVNKELSGQKFCRLRNQHIFSLRYLLTLPNCFFIHQVTEYKLFYTVRISGYSGSYISLFSPTNLAL